VPRLATSKSFPIALAVGVLATLLWSAIGPHDWFTWWLEVFPALAGLVILLATWRRFPFTNLTYTLVALHMVILIVGGHYTYALVPLGEWLRDTFHLSRNHYDRLGHFAQGFVPAIIAREILVRWNIVASARWRTFFILCICLALSACYELFECAVALFSGQAAEAFLGTQGDPWDTQTDMACALAGTILALALLARWHDHQLRAANIQPSH
jgi:putative membrane protein